jgi:multidrug efflux pump subunit AcrA (membrane-fusion protein)
VLRLRLFLLCALVLSALALTTSIGFASPMLLPVGDARVTLALTPDPPQTGTVHAIITIDGVSTTRLANTTISFGSVMPSMNMGGPSGNAHRVGKNQWAFDATLAMASTWNVTLRFTGGIVGETTYRFAVTGKGSSGGGMGGGNVDAWRTAAFALAVVLLAGVIAAIRAQRARRPLVVVLAAIAGVIVLALGVFQARFAAPPMDMASMERFQGDAPTPVTLARIDAGSRTSLVITAPGSVAPYLVRDIVVRTAGVLSNFTAYAGDRVHVGETIATLDEPELRSRAAAASADADAQRANAQAADIDAEHHGPAGVSIANDEANATANELTAAHADGTAKVERARYWHAELRREETLLAQGAVARQEYEDERAQAVAAFADEDGAQARVDALTRRLSEARMKVHDAVANAVSMRTQAVAAHAQAERASFEARSQTTLAEYATVIAPGDGVVMKRLVDSGTYVQAGTVIARIAAVDRLRVQANVAQGDLAGIALGTPLEAHLSNGRVIRGRVTSIAPVADSTTHTATIEAIIANESGVVPGDYVRVTLRVRAALAPHSVRVPSLAVVGSGEAAAVWVDANDAAHRVPVHVLADDGTTATVSGVLPRGGRVVVDGAAMLEEGQPITERHS